MEKIEYKVYGSDRNAKFSIIIPTWNNLDYVRLCVDSIRKNSRFSHEIIIHVNDGSDGTRKWVEEQELDHSSSPGNVGICYAVNAAATLATTNYIVYMNDDMYVCPDWDFYLWEEIEALDHDRFFFSGTMIEPEETSNTCNIAASRFGNSAQTFNEKLLLEQYSTFPKQDWQGGTWPPNIVHRDLWRLVGGYSVELSPGMYSDPDFSMKLWEVGVRLFKGVAQSRVFHFQRKTTGKIEKNDGRKQFREKWKIPCSQFNKLYLRLGEPFDGPLRPPMNTWRLKWARFRSQWM